jgi:glyoxylase-like metal-dependent hydrolase (beta-lactamase superfamily II)/rhodanese-related sulfurtransferase
MQFHTIADEGCRSYLIGCPETGAAALIDPAFGQIDRTLGLIAREGLALRYVVETHTHADHFTAARGIRQRTGAPVVMHAEGGARDVDLRVEDGHQLVLGSLRLKVLHTPGHTRDSMCLHVADRVFTGDTLLIGGTGRTDLPTGDPEALYDSLFAKLLLLPDETLVFPAHDYLNKGHSTIGAEKADNRRLQHTEREAFVSMMRSLDLAMPTHLTEALRTNISGGITVRQLLADAAAKTPFMAMDELVRRIGQRRNDFVILDVREANAWEKARIPGSRHLARGQLELKIDETFPDPEIEILTVCEFGKLSTLAAATLRELGFTRTVALDGGMKAWREAGHPLDSGGDPALMI